MSINLVADQTLEIRIYSLFCGGFILLQAKLNRQVGCQPGRTVCRPCLWRCRKEPRIGVHHVTTLAKRKPVYFEHFLEVQLDVFSLHILMVELCIVLGNISVIMPSRCYIIYWN